MYISLHKQVHTTATTNSTLALHVNGSTKMGLNHDLTDFEKGMIVGLQEGGFELCQDRWELLRFSKGSNLRDVQWTEENTLHNICYVGGGSQYTNAGDVRWFGPQVTGESTSRPIPTPNALHSFARCSIRWAGEIPLLFILGVYSRKHQ